VGRYTHWPLLELAVLRKEVESSVTAATATLLCQDSELLIAQVELHRDEQENTEVTPRGVHLRVSTLEGP
jgi:hypothetical protein